jgi:hypothetical protein
MVKKELLQLQNKIKIKIWKKNKTKEKVDQQINCKILKILNQLNKKKKSKILEVNQDKMEKIKNSLKWNTEEKFKKM